MDSETSRDIRIDARGYSLAASIHTAPDTETVLLLNSATGVPRHFYKHFAARVQANGWTAVTYDYRGIGDSAPQNLRGFEARIRDWVLSDMTSVVDWITTELRPRRLFAVGHSFGGQTLGMIESPNSIAAAVGVSAQSGYWGVQPGDEKYKVWFGVSVMMPMLSRLFGYLPWSLFASGEDLPKGVALEWSAWCRKPNYLLDDESLPLSRYKSFTAPILAYSIDDDKWGSARAVDEMMRAYGNVSRRHIIPAEHDIEHIGHMGWFKKGSEKLWDETLDWLDQHG